MRLAGLGTGMRLAGLGTGMRLCFHEHQGSLAQLPGLWVLFCYMYIGKCYKKHPVGILVRHKASATG